MAAAVFTRTRLTVAAPHNDHESYAVTDEPEAASQVFDAGSPVVRNAGGFIASAADPVTAIFGIATDFARNTAGNGDVNSKVCPLTPRDREIICNLIEAADADHVLLATDLGSEVGMELGTIPIGGTAWMAVVGGTGFEVVGFQGDEVPPLRTDSRGIPGDTNARVAIVANADILSTNS